MSVLAQSVGTLWRVIESYGLDPAPFFEAEGLEVDLPIEPGTRVSYEVVDAIRSAAAQATGDPAFGLRTAECLHPSYLGALGYAVLASDTLRVAFERIHRYVRVLNEQGRFDLTVTDGTLGARISVGQPSRNRTARDDGQTATLLTLCRLNAGADFTPRRITLVHDAPADPAPYETLFRCPVVFGAEANEFVIDLEDAERILPSSNEVLAQMNERIVIQRLAQLDRDNLTGRVRAEIMELLPSGEVSDEAVADALHMTSRTLHRRLKDEGESFRTLLTAVRRDLAEQYLADRTLTLTEITFLLGFSEMSSFSRAYKHWTGQPPSAARQRE